MVARCQRKGREREEAEKAKEARERSFEKGKKEREKALANEDEQIAEHEATRLLDRVS